jgi:2-phospho-L-lactate guanylyltransferase
VVAAIVPVKRLEEAKRRLSGFLSPLERRRLSIAMLLDVLDSLERNTCIGKIYIVTPDEEIEDIVNTHYKKVEKIGEPEHSNLNRALRHAALYVEASAFSRCLIIPADLPLIKTGDIESLLRQAEDTEMAIVPDKTWYGTNLLLLQPPSIIQPCFGPGSFSRHIRQAKEKGISYKVVSTRYLRWDIDCPGDIPPLICHGYGTRTYRELFRLGINERIRSHIGRDIGMIRRDLSLH